MQTFAENEKYKQEIAKGIQSDNDSLTGNIHKVLSTISRLIEQLSKINNLDQILYNNGESNLDYKYYFTDFNVDKGKGYIENNFWQDLETV